MFDTTVTEDLGAAVTALQQAPTELATGAESAATLRMIQAAQDKLDGLKAEHLANLSVTRGYEDDEASSVTMWARRELRLPSGQARALVAADQTMRTLPGVKGAATSGLIRHDHVREFTFGIRHIDAHKIAANEDWLLDVARTCDPAELHDIIRKLRDAFYPDDLDKKWARGMDKEDIHVNKVTDGYHLTGFLSIVTGAKLKTVLDSLSTPRDRDDNRPAAERRTDALDRMLTSELQHGLPTDLGLRPQLNVTIDLDTLIRQQNGEVVLPPTHLDWFGPIGPKLASALLCNSSVTALLATDTTHLTVNRITGNANPKSSGGNNSGEVGGGNSVVTGINGTIDTSGKPGKAHKNQQADILNVGRTARIANPQQRRAVVTRQNGICATIGCTNPHLEIHHVRWWSHGGPTDLNNLIGLCSRCHHLVHRELLHITPNSTGGHTVGRQPQPVTH